MICRPCARAADNAAVLGAEWATSKHQTCPGDTWCDCQHRIPAGIPRSMAAVGTAENGQLVALAAGIELEDLEHRRLAAETKVFNPAYRVARCGQQSAHGPHVMEHGPDQPRNCPGTAARLAESKES